MAEKKLETFDEVIDEVRSILNLEGQGLRAFLLRDMVLNVLKCKRDELDILDLKVLNRAMAEFRYAAKVFKPYRDTRKVSIFGSARAAEDLPYYQMAVELGQRLAENGFMVITGAAQGIMRAGIEGAGAENSFGVNILLPFEKPSAVIQDDPKLITFRYFFTRKIFFVMEGDAFALLPGGFGTQDEAFEVLTLLQTGKAPPMPLVLVELRGETYWESWDRFIREQLLGRGYISEEDLSFYKIAYSPQEAEEWIQSYYSVYHSCRQVQDKLVIRLEREPSDGLLETLSRRYGDMSGSGEFTAASALPEEKDEPELSTKPRIVFPYNRKRPGRLNQMIWAINTLGKGA